jgi:hypothetical protein
MQELRADTIRAFHDGWFDGVVFPGDKTVRLLLRTVAKERFTVFLRGVEVFKMWNVREGNIILDLTILRTDQLTTAHIASVYDLSKQGAAEQATKLLDSAQRADLKLFQMNSSYGAECLALCEIAELSEQNKGGASTG